MATAPVPRVMPVAAPAAPCAAEVSDGTLLARFVRHQDEAAFEALVRRHGPMVFRVCRRVLRDGVEAEDAFQATFIVLARKAGSVLKQESVGSWLYGVAYRVATRARARAGRRLSREQLQRDFIPPSSSRSAAEAELIWRDLCPTLDEEVNRLPEKYRSPVLLCYFEGKTNEEAAAQLACPVGTVKIRLMRARDLLRERLTRRGLALSASAFGTMLVGEGAVMALPAVMVDAAVQGATHGRVAVGAGALVDAALEGMVLARLNSLATIVVLAGLLAMLIPWGAGAWQRVTTLPPHSAKVTCVALNSDGNLLASIATNDPHVKVRDLAANREWTIPTAAVAAEFHVLGLSPDGSSLAIESFDYPWGRKPAAKTTLKIVDTRTGRERFSLVEPGFLRHMTRFSADGRQLLVAAHEPNTTRVRVEARDLATGKVDKLYRGPAVPAATVAMSRDGLLLALGSTEWSRQPGRIGIRLWDLASERELGVLSDASLGVGFCVFSPDNRLLVVTEADTHVGPDDNGVTFQIWDTTGRKPRRTFTFGPEGSYVTRVSFSEDGKTVALNGKIGNRALAKFYDVGTGKERQVIEGGTAEKNGFTALAFSSDGRTLALGEQNGSVALWKWKR